MTLPLSVPGQQEEVLFLQLAREIAIDHLPLETILKNYQIELNKWENIKANPRFIQLLESEIAAWGSATNTHERTKLKAAALVEQWLPEANQRLHDPNENLPAKVELGKLLTRIGGMGLNQADITGGGERLSVTINLGSDKELKFEKNITHPQIDGEAMEVE